MLVLTRKVGERIQIGDHIVITVVRINGSGVRLGVEAPADMLVVREELADPSTSNHAHGHARALHSKTAGP